MKHYLNYIEASIKRNWADEALSNYGKNSYSYAQVAVQIERLHIAMFLAGIEPGDKVVLCAKNSAQWGIAFLAAVTYDAVAVPLLNEFLPASVQSLTDHSDATVLFTDAAMWRELDVAAMPKLKAAFNIQDFAPLFLADSQEEDDSFSKHIDTVFATRFPKGLKPENVSYPTGSLDELEIINYTSGTTSTPKGVMLSARAVSSNMEFALENMPSAPGETILSMLPMAHMYGLAFEFLFPFTSGNHIYFLGKTPTPSILIKALADVKPYMLITVPLVIEKIFKSKVFPMLDKPSTRYLMRIPMARRIVLGKVRERLLRTFGGQLHGGLIVGGAAINEKVELLLHRMHFPYTVGYGMTECAPLICYASAHSFVPRSSGRIVDRMELRVDSADATREAGEISVRGDCVMMGYYKNAAATRAVLDADGWMRTGDIGTIDAGGNLFIRGRSKNMILGASGQNIYPEEIEDKLNANPLVTESIVVSRSGKLVAMVVLDAEGVKALEANGRTVESALIDLQAQVNAQLPAYSRIGRTEVQEEPFEKTPKKSIKRFLYN